MSASGDGIPFQLHLDLRLALGAIHDRDQDLRRHNVHVRSDGWIHDCSTVGDVLHVPHIQQAIHLRFLEAGCALMHHLRHLLPIVRLGVAISCAVGASGIGAS